MTRFNRFLSTCRTIWHNLTTEAVRSFDGVIASYDYYISDGVDYSQPYALPGWLRRQMDTNAQLREDVTTAMNSTYNSQFGNPYRSGSDLPIMPTTEDPHREWDAATRERVSSNCHAAYQRNPLAHAAINFTTDFVIGDGFNLTCKNEQVEELLNAFIDNSDNAIRIYEREAVNDLQVDGELILRFFGKGEEMVMVPQRPWELQYIKTESGFFRRAELYHFNRQLTEGDAPTGTTKTEQEDVPAADIHFVAINKHGYELRGRSELYRILPWLRADKEFIEDRARQNRWRGALLWHVQVANATPAAIAAVVARWRKPPSPGSAYVSTDNEIVTALTNSANAGDASHDARAIRLMNILGLRLPEYFFADGENANLASSTNQQLPALTKFESFQQIMVEQVWTPVFKRVIQDAVDAGMIKEEVDEIDSNGDPVYEPEKPEEYPDEQPAEPVATAFDVQKTAVAQANMKPSTNGSVPALPSPAEAKPKPRKTCLAIEAFEVSYEPVKSQDLAALTTMLTTATASGWASNQTAAEKLGFDPSIEQKRMAKETQADLTAMAQGTKPIPPEMRPEGDTGEDEKVGANGKSAARNQ